MARAGFWKCDECQVRWYGQERCWMCDQPGRQTNSVYPPEVRST